MDISSAARDLRELSQITIDDKVGAGGARVPSSADVGRARSGGLKAGRSKGKGVDCQSCIFFFFSHRLLCCMRLFFASSTLLLVLRPATCRFC